MNYLLDSNVVSAFYDKFSLNHQQIAQQLASLSSDDKVFISIITFYELEYGYSNAPYDKKEVIRIKIEEAKKDFSILPLTLAGSLFFGQLKKKLINFRELKKENAKKHNIDIILASSAILNSCFLVSSDRIYSDLKKEEPQLKTIDWSE